MKIIRFHPSTLQWLLGLGVALAGMVGSVMLSVQQRESARQVAHERFMHSVDAFSDALVKRVQAYTEIAFGLRSLFVAHPDVSRAAFASAVAQLDPVRRHPGIKNIAFTRYVAAAHKQAFETQVRTDTSLDPLGYPDFAIRPAGARDEYFVADFLWPMRESKSVHGLDISAQPTNLASMRYAIATAQPTASGPFDLMQETTHRTGFVVRVPVFRSAPTDAADQSRQFLGSVAVTLRVHDLFNTLLKESRFEGLQIALVDKGSSVPDTPVGQQLAMFSSMAPGVATLAPHRRELSVYGRIWQLDFQPAAPFLSESERSAPFSMGAAGVLISVLLGLLVGLLGRSRYLALQKAASSQVALQESELRWRFAIEGAGDGLWDWNIPTRQVFYSERWKEMLGFGADEVGREVQAWKACLHPDDRHRVLTEIELSLQPNASKIFNEHRVICKDGRLRWVLARGLVVARDDAGRAVRMVGTYADITERRQATDELVVHQNKLEELVAQRTEALVRAEFINDQALDLAKAGPWCINFSEGDTHYISSPRTIAILGDPVHDDLRYPLRAHWYVQIAAADPALADAALRNYQDALAGRVPRFDAIHPYRRPADGRVIWVHVMGQVTRDVQGMPINVYGVVMDISAERLAEEEIRLAKVAADVANRAKSDFLANMSHEIRTPLNAISGMARLIGHGELSAEQRSRLGKLELAGDHLLRTINSILDLSKIEAGKLELEDAPVQLDEVVQSVVSILADRAQAKRIRLTGRVDNVPLPLRGDPTRLVQALLNLAANAVKFTDAGAVSVHATVLEDFERSVRIRFEVQDTGIGIEPQAVPRLFSSFEQVDNSIARRYGGTGLGLAITKRLAHMMDGDAGVQSTLGQGSLFWFTARLSKDLGRLDARDAAQAQDWQQILQERYAGRRILLAEDDEFNQEIALILLEDAGQVVDVAEDGRMAVELCARRPYDLILMDMQMPHMDGIEATRLIRQQAQGALVPIIALTGNAFSEDKAQCLSAGMDDFITKPVDPNKLYQALVRWYR